MSSELDQQIENLKKIIAEMESQRQVLGDAAVDASLIPFQEKLAELQAQVNAQKDSPPIEPVRQRKLVTLLYMDVVGSTAMTQHLDPEDAMEIMDNAIVRLAEPVAAHALCHPPPHALLLHQCTYHRRTEFHSRRLHQVRFLAR